MIGSGGSRMSNPWSVGMWQSLVQMEMAYLHWRKRTRVQARIRIPNPMATLYYTEHIHIAQTWTQILAPCFCVGQELASESVPESVSGNVNKPLK